MAPEIVFEEEGHTYKVDDEPYPSVTHIIKSVVPVPFERAAWFGFKAAQRGERLDDARNAAAKRGSLVHKALETMAKGGTPDEFDYEHVAGYVEALDKFFDANDPEFHDTECSTASVIHRYAGTLDGFCTFRKGKHKGATARLDLKTGRIYPESHFPQLEAYEWAEVERGKPKSDLRLVLDVKDDEKLAKPRYRLVQSTDTFDDFFVLLQTYRSMENRKKRMKRK
jgi:hypothetical protein